MITFRGVTKSYGGEPVFSDLDLYVEDGEFVLLTGKSGVGKSTLLRLLLKEEDYDSGSILVDGRELSTIAHKEIPFYRRQIGMVFQDFSLLQDRTVYENVELARRIVGAGHKGAASKITAVLQLLGIADLHKRYPRELSGGQQQKVALARALVNNPSYLFADEPTGNLDPGASREIMQLFSLAQKQGTTVIVATHEKEMAEGLSYREIQL